MNTSTTPFSNVNETLNNVAIIFQSGRSLRGRSRLLNFSVAPRVHEEILQIEPGEEQMNTSNAPFSDVNETLNNVAIIF